MTITFSLTATHLYAEGPQAPLRPAEPGKIWIDPVNGMTFSWIPEGCFQMGQTETETNYLLEKAGTEQYNKYYKDELPRHQACLTGFWMAQTAVTVKQFRQFVEETGYQTDAEKQGKAWIYNQDTQWKWEEREGYTWKNPGYEQGDNHPVVNVSWTDAKTFIAWLSKKTGQNYRLPTEAQWEYAARAGSTAMRFWGDSEAEACKYANIGGKETGWSPSFPCDDGFTFTSPVGTYKPNAFNLYDMLGNTWEWCEDMFNPKAYDFPSDKDPLMTEGNPFGFRVYRGGSWLNVPQRVRSAYRFRFSWNIRLSNLGFRVCMVQD